MWEFLTGDTSPWWTTLLGTIVGAVISYFATSSGDKRRARRESEARLRSEKRAAVLLTTSTCTKWQARMLRAWSSADRRDAEDMKRLSEEMAVLLDELSHAIASTDTIPGAEDLATKSRELWAAMSTARVQMTEVERTALSNDLVAKRDALTAAVREETKG